MGKLILCNGIRTKRPYVFTSTGIHIYSIEELCYYLFNHVYFIDEELLSNSLFDWIGTELKLAERAEKLKQLKKQKADLKTIITVIMCSADYYSENEIKELLKRLDDIIGMPPYKRNFIKANRCLKDKQFTEAVMEYERILNAEEAATLTPEEYGDILHNLAVAKIHIADIREASESFCQAYERNHREESLQQYLYTVKLCNSMDIFKEKVQELQVEEAFCNHILQNLEQVGSEAEDSGGMLDIRQLKLSKPGGRTGDYYKRSKEIIDLWKESVRQI